MSIRVLCCSGSLEGGGSERQLLQLASGLDRSSFAPQIYLHYRRGSLLQQVPDVVPVHDFWSHYDPATFRIPGQTHCKQVEHLQNLMRCEKIDAVYDRTFHMTLVTGPASRIAGCPRVSVIVSPPSRDFARSRERFAFLKKWLLRRAYGSSAGCTLAVSDDVAEDASRFYRLNRERIQVLRNPVDLKAVMAGAKAEQPELVPVSKRVCVVGRMSDEKGQNLAIEAFSKAQQSFGVREIALELVGDGPNRPQLEALARSLPGGSQIHFHGFQENPYPFIASADLLIIPSDYEGLPNVALEAMCLHTPVIATDCSLSLNELLGGVRGLRGQITAYQDVDGLAAAIVCRFENPGEWQQRVNQAFQYVSQFHGLQPWLATMEQLLMELSSQARGGPVR